MKSARRAYLNRQRTDGSWFDSSHHTTKAFLPHQRVTTEGKAMEDEIEEFDEHPQDDMSQYQDYPYEYDY
ncbi:hypothetical protein MMP96_09675 [Enterobacter hormaechei]|uniref:hypothetical protein n=1 Tax=Enterobacter hormaechei TaxID=158836 RepID=UPI001F4D5469|nr:hypothetical protein [Enterobacter hormaechei]MCH9329791.1 hypothetical protein [Enterobacter hormaechei]MCH9425643.1 hypothetical protein [Enterobacter hormaechei]